MTSKSWFGTLNNWTESEYEQIINLTGITYAIIGKEKGADGTPHLQFVISLKASKRLVGMKKLLPRAHLEIPRDLEASRTYCKKEKDFIEIDNREPGARKDLEIACELAVNNGLLEVAKAMPMMYVKYNKGLEKLRSILASENKEFKKLEVIVIWGEPGLGKSRYVREIDPNVYSVPEPLNGSLWFDGYDGQDSILFDDFYGWIKYHTLLQMTDGYPMMIPVKGGFATKQWSKVFITSNKTHDLWYDRPECVALTRRITSTVHLTSECFL